MVNEIVAAGRSPATAEKALRTLSAVMAAAVDARVIRDNPCRGVRPPRAASRHEPRFLTPAEVEALAARLRAPYDLLRGTVRVSRSLERGGTVKGTKTHARWVVHRDESLGEELTAHVQARRLRPSWGNRWP